jgi:uncharacterized membrane protein
MPRPSLTLVAAEPSAPTPSPASSLTGPVLRSMALGLAAGARTSLGVAAQVVHWSGRDDRPRSRLATAGAVGSVLAVVGELVGDKLPQTPSRLDLPGPVVRVATGVAGAALLSRRDRTAAALPVLAGAVGALAGTYGGAAWRSWASRRVPDWQAAVVEDVLALVLAGTAARSSG